MARIKAQPLSTLDLLRRRHGNEAARGAFYEMCTQDNENATRLLNDDNLKFPTLFVLQPEVDKFELHERLNERNHSALSMCGCLCDKENMFNHEFGPQDKPTLRWMMLTGYDEDDLGETYDEIMDTTAILLVREHHDNTCLKPLCDMIFMRNRHGMYIYDAVWALFESQEVDTLLLVADHLRSNNRHDVELARNLLSFVPCFQNNLSTPAVQHRCAVRWIHANRKWLRYTGESNQKGGNPYRFEVSLEAKYLQNSEVPRMGPATLSADDYELGCRFHALDPDTRVLLADHSQRLRRHSPEKWQRWLHSDLSVQIHTARQCAGLEVRP